METIDDLEKQLSESNVCLASQNKTIDALEEELDLQIRKLKEAEEKLFNLQQTFNPELSQSASCNSEVEVRNYFNFIFIICKKIHNKL